MSTFRDQPLEILTFQDLIKHEAEIVRRINATANGGRLLLIDASRFLADIGVTLNDAALFEWRRHAGYSVAAPSPSHTAYDAVSHAPRDERVRIHVRNLLRKEKP